MSPEQERELVTYLRADQGKLDKVIENQHRLSSEFLLMRSSMESDFKVFGHRLAGVESRVGNLERDAEVTGQHNIEELKKQVTEARAFNWKVVAIAVAVFLGGSGVGGALVHALH